jgi:predicted DCC family thiol-disulfide oxidoreductase YuxK
MQLNNALPSGARVEVFFDGGCPLCLREINALKRFDRGRQRIVFTDIAAPAFEAARHGTDQATLMGKIHGRLADGSWIEGVEVLRQLYAAVGFGWLVSLTRVPGISHLLELGYGWFAVNRLRLTGRCVDGGCELPDAGARG